MADSTNTKIGDRFSAIAGYQPVNPDEVQLLPGDIVSIMAVYDDGWVMGMNERLRLVGLLPRNFLAANPVPSPSSVSLGTSTEKYNGPPKIVGDPDTGFDLLGAAAAASSTTNLTPMVRGSSISKKPPLSTTTAPSTSTLVDDHQPSAINSIGLNGGGGIVDDHPLPAIPTSSDLPPNYADGPTQETLGDVKTPFNLSYQSINAPHSPGHSKSEISAIPVGGDSNSIRPSLYNNNNENSTTPAQSFSEMPSTRSIPLASAISMLPSTDESTAAATIIEINNRNITETGVPLSVEAFDPALPPPAHLNSYNIKVKTRATASSELSNPIPLTSVDTIMRPAQTVTATCQELLEKLKKTQQKLALNSNSIPANIGSLKILFVGDSGIGKTSMVESFSKLEFVSASEPLPTQPFLSTTSITEMKISTIPADAVYTNEDPYNITLVDTPGFGAQMDAISTIEPIVKQVLAEFQKTDESFDKLAKVPNLVRFINTAKGCHTHVDICVYGILHRLKPVDLEFMRRLGPVVNLVPVIVKCDTLKPTEIASLKISILEEIVRSHIPIYGFGLNNEELLALARSADSANVGPPIVPFAISNHSVMTAGATNEFPVLIDSLLFKHVDQLRLLTAQRFVKWRSTRVERDLVRAETEHRKAVEEERRRNEEQQRAREEAERREQEARRREYERQVDEANRRAEQEQRLQYEAARIQELQRQDSMLKQQQMQQLQMQQMQQVQQASPGSPLQNRWTMRLFGNKERDHHNQPGADARRGSLTDPSSSTPSPSATQSQPDLGAPSQPRPKSTFGIVTVRK